MKLLALETATDACSVALYCDGTTLQRHALAPQRHTLLLLPMVRELCAEAGITPAALDAIAVGIGPGAFTGVRVATAVAQGLAYAHDLDVVEVSTLAALAQGGYRRTGIRQWLATLDARRHEAYWAHYSIDAVGIAIATTPASVSAAPDIALPAGKAWRAVGTGWPAYAVAMTGTWPDFGPVPVLMPEAQDIVTLGLAGLKAGQVIRAEALAPTYLRAAV